MKRRQRAQAIGLAAVSLVAMVGMLAFVIDAGLLFMAHREAQDAADAAALAGVQELANDSTTCSPDCLKQVGTYASRNYGILGRLCSDPTYMSPPPAAGALQAPQPKVLTLTVSVNCTATLTFCRILWDQSQQRTYPIGAEATAAIGNAVIDCPTLKSTGEITDFTKNPSSTATTGSTTTQIVAPPGTLPGTSLCGYRLAFGPGAINAGQSRTIKANDPNSITVDQPFDLPPANNDPFTVLQHLTRLIH